MHHSTTKLGCKFLLHHEYFCCTFIFTIIIAIIMMKWLLGGLQGRGLTYTICKFNLRFFTATNDS